MKTKRLLFVIVPIILIAVIVASVLYLDNLKRTRPEFLINADWSRYDSFYGENFNISFDKNGKYTYTSESGIGTEYTQGYDRYSYNKRFDRIEISGTYPDDFMSVVYRDKHNLCLLFDYEVHCFKNLNDPVETEVVDSVKKYVDDENSVNLTFLGYKQEHISVAPYNYDADARDNFTEYITELECADNIKFTSITVKIENGIEDITVYDLDGEDREYIGERYTSGFLKFGEYGLVKEVVFYGSTVVW